MYTTSPASEALAWFTQGGAHSLVIVLSMVLVEKDRLRGAAVTWGRWAVLAMTDWLARVLRGSDICRHASGGYCRGPFVCKAGNKTGYLPWI